MLERNEQTICAISTPHGVGGIAVIRVSGKDSLNICKIFSEVLKNKKIESHRVYFSNFYDAKKNKVDEVLFTFFSEGKSFTGEETVEISCHGSRFVTQQILDLLIQGGARIADKGEFTYRAFMNGRLDLVQAESVLGLIESQNKAAAKVALRQLDGYVSKEFEILISDLTWCLAHIEASIDFIEQGIEVVDNNILKEKLSGISITLEKLINSYTSGRLIKDGIRIALIGEPNVGKSSLLNLLVQNDKAIVTPIAGTTRDVIEVETIFDGVKFNIIDTAGLRDTQDQVEIIGINRSKKEADKADVLCFVLDCTLPDWNESLKIIESARASKKILLLNKKDAVSESQQKELLKRVSHSSINEYLLTSAQAENSRKEILNLVKKTVGSLEFLDEAIISSSRQLEQTQYAFEMISKSIAELDNNLGAEFVAMYLKESLISLQKILGQVYDDQIMDRVFKEFCLGK
jgi:tRNA modification GTPase